MKASDVMTTPVVTISPDTTVREVAALLLDRRISGVPVVDAGRVVGIVSEGDLLRRQEIGTGRERAGGSWWLRLFRDDPSPADYVKSHGGRASDIMTREVITVTEETPIGEIAEIFAARGVKRVPVLRGERLVGIVSRADLVQALAMTPRAAKQPRAQGDHAIRRRLLAELERQGWWRPSGSSVIVTDGVVHYWGLLDSQDEKDAARIAAENVPGVRGVEDHRLRYADLPSSV
jgi:CBS domain-containing protein